MMLIIVLLSKIKEFCDDFLEIYKTLKMSKNRSIELMAPAGSYEALTTAINAGCNSVYYWSGTVEHAFSFFQQFHN